MTACRTVLFARSLRRAAVAAATLACALAVVPEVGASQSAQGAGAAQASPVAAQAEPGAGATRSVAGEELALKLRALTELGARYEHSEGMGRDFARAHDLYCEAARADYADALIRLGWMYANGRGVRRDDSTANTLFRRAADAGSNLAARLAGAIRGDEARLPDCMTVQAAAVAPEPIAAAVPEPKPDYGPTPSVDAPATFRPAPTSVEYKKLVTTVLQFAKDFRLDPRLVFSLIRVESNFDPLARSQRNAQGLMQLIPETAERFAVTDAWNPIENLRGGMSYLRWLLSYFRGDVVLTLAAYNAGEGAVDRHRGVPPYPETLAYVQRIRTFYPLDRHPFDPKVAASFGTSPVFERAGGAGPARAASAPALRPSATPATRPSAAPVRSDAGALAGLRRPG